MKAYECSADDRCVMQTVQWTESTWPPSHGRNSYILLVIFSQSSVFSAFTRDDDFGRFQELYEVDSGHYVDEIHEVLKDSQRGGDWTLYLLHGQNTDSGSFSKPASFQVHLKLLLLSLSYTSAHFLGSLEIIDRLL